MSKHKVGCLGYTAAAMIAILSAIVLELFPLWTIFTAAAAFTFVAALLGELLK